ncbi:MAG: L-tyrosine/L-tryptophan isonitrile synthase family protein, partial [Leuconostoc gelidum]
MIIRERWRELRLLSPSQQVATILSSKKFRNGNSFDVKNYLTKCLENSKESIQFVLPSFPFKIPNPLKTWHHNLDAGEMLCLQRLYLISFFTQELMNKKTEFIIISDGLIYSDLCDVDAFEYKSYSQRAKQIIDKMGIQDNIKYVDMMNDVLSDKQDEYDQTLQQVQHELKDWWKNNMSGNINTNDIDYSVLRSMTQENVNSVFEVYSETLQRRASQKAFEFTSKLETLRVMDAVLQKYEICIRATVHP